MRKKSYKCGTCSKIFSKYDELGTHIRTEHKKYFQCVHCGQNFSLIEEMTNHVKNVHAELNDKNKCDICNESFKSPELLLLHKKNEHESVKNMEQNINEFKCKLCSKNFPTKSKLTNHINYDHKDNIEKENEQIRALLNQRALHNPIDFKSEAVNYKNGNASGMN